MKKKSNLASYLLEWRKSKGYSQGDLASIMRISPQYVSNVERCVHAASTAYCLRLLKLMTNVERDRMLDLLMDEYMERSAIKAALFTERKRDAKTKRTTT